MMRQRLNQPIWWTIGGAAAVGLVLASILVLLRPRSPLPAHVRQQLNFALVYPAPATQYAIDQQTITYNSQAKALTFTTAGPSGTLVFSEQATPDAFTDAPDYFQKLTEKLHDYEDFDSAMGHVALTRPDELNGAQSAVVNGNGTLLFIHPSHDLSTDDWRKLISNLQVAK